MIWHCRSVWNAFTSMISPYMWTASHHSVNWTLNGTESSRSARRHHSTARGVSEWAPAKRPNRTLRPFQWDRLPLNTKVKDVHADDGSSVSVWQMLFGCSPFHIQWTMAEFCFTITPTNQCMRTRTRIPALYKYFLKCSRPINTTISCKKEMHLECFIFQMADQMQCNENWINVKQGTIDTDVNLHKYAQIDNSTYTPRVRGNATDDGLVCEWSAQSNLEWLSVYKRTCLWLAFPVALMLKNFSKCIECSRPI